MKIESGVKAVLVPGGRSRALPAAARAEAEPKLAADDLATWKALAKDTEINESVRRKQVHELLASAGPVGPPTLTKRIYKDILHAALADPSLGGGSSFFGIYPLRDERAH